MSGDNISIQLVQLSTRISCFFPFTGRITLTWGDLRPSTDRCCLLGDLGVAYATNTLNREGENEGQRCSRHLASSALAP